MSSRRVNSCESERVRGQNGSVGAEQICSGDVSEALTEVLREEIRLPRAPASGEGKDLGGEKSVVHTSLNSPNCSGGEGRDHPSKKAKVTGTDHRPGVSGDNTVAKPFHWQFSHSKDCPITEDQDSVAHLVRHFKPGGCPLSSLRNMLERDAFVKMAVAHAKGGDPGTGPGKLNSGEPGFLLAGILGTGVPSSGDPEAGVLPGDGELWAFDDVLETMEPGALMFPEEELA
ncbi:hypothetical protein F2Q70_00038426 [Brassica cretica]|uniref:Uncharacterized protein n=1 Tax=Brassica cretica TaxID=69181 RepID=A0A8S9K4W5_BRACR|nr:hypothetical protein F2Q70_00038426 [Brassica cretica]